MRLTSPTLLGVVLCAGQLVAAELGKAGAQQAIAQGNGNERKDKANGEGKGPLTEEFRKYVDGLLEEWHVPGFAIGVVDGDDTWTEGYGIATYPSTPVTSSTLFYCASTSKAFTAAALAIMISSGNYTVPSLPGTATPLAWDTPIAQLIPDDFVLADPWATTHLTLEDALSHRTGLPRHDKASTHRVPAPAADQEGHSTGTGTAIATGTRTATIRDGVRFLRYLPLNAAPRTKWQYCNQMFVVATHVIQTLTGGRWLGDVLRAWIWAPLGMDATYFSLEDALAAPQHFARGYSWSSQGQGVGQGQGWYNPVPYMPTDEIGGAGAVVSNVEDYTRWIRMLLREEEPLSKEGHKAIKTPRMIIDPETVLGSLGKKKGDGAKAKEEKKSPYDFPSAYAFGWEVSSYRGHTFWTHAGGMHAYGAEVFFFPDLDFGVVTFGNTAGTSNYVGVITVWKLVDDKLGIPEEERHDWAADYKGWEDRMNATIANAINKYYPHRPNRPSPPALPLDAYKGTYFHPGYLNFTLQLSTDPEVQTYLSRDNVSFVAVRTDATWPTVNEFEHVSGEYWMMYQYYKEDPRGPLQEYAPVEFQVGPEGKVKKMGITWLSVSASGQDTVEGLVWFDKIE